MSRVLLINGSPNEFGCTYTALSEVKKSLEKNGVAAEIYYLGKPAIHGCTGYDACSKLDRCVYDDAVNAVAARLDEFDGIVVGSAGALQRPQRAGLRVYGQAVLFRG